jgi:hypothetical protein
MASTDSTLIPRDLSDNLKAVYRTLLEVKLEMDENQTGPPDVLAIIAAADYNNYLAILLLKELHRIGLIKLRSFVASLEPAENRIGLLRGLLDLLGLPQVPLAEGTQDLLYRLLKEARCWEQEFNIICLSSPTEIVQFSKDYPKSLAIPLRRGKLVLQGGYSIVNGKLKVDVEATNNVLDPDAATIFYNFLQEYKVPSIVFNRNAATNLKHPHPRTLFNDIASTSEIAQYLDKVAELQEATFSLDATLAAAVVMNNKAIDRLKIIETSRSALSNTIHQVVGNGSEPNSLDATGDGMCTYLEALLRGSLLAASQGLSSDPKPIGWVREEYYRLKATYKPSQDEKIAELKKVDKKNCFIKRYCVCPGEKSAEEQINSPYQRDEREWFLHNCRDQAGKYVSHGTVEVYKDGGRLKILPILSIDY